MTDTENQERIAQVRARLSAAAVGPWSWSRTYELPDDDGNILQHWCLHNPVSDAIGGCIDGWLVLDTASPIDFGGKPLDQSPNFALIASAPTDLAFLLSRVDSLESALREAQKDAERIDYLQERRSAGHSIAFATSLDALMTAAQHTNTWDRNGNIREAIDAAKASR